jgi:hypothetical protein
MAGIKITEYPNTQTSFDNDDEFDVSAYQGPSVVYQTRKYTWSTLKTALLAYFGQIWPSGIRGSVMSKGASAWQATTNIFVGYGVQNGKIGIGTQSPNSTLHVEVTDTSVAKVAQFENAVATGTNDRGQFVKIGNSYYGSVSALGYANGYGQSNDAFVLNDSNLDSNINLVSWSKNSVNWKGHICFYTDAVNTPPTNGVQPPLQINKQGALQWKEMITNGFAHNQGFKVTNVDTAGHSTTGEYIEIQIKGVTRYIELFS